MEYKEDIEQLFKNTFDNFEADVNPDAWMNIQAGLNLNPAADVSSSANNASTGSKLAASSSKFSVSAIIGTTAAVIGIIGSVIYFSSDNETPVSSKENELKIEQTAPAVSEAIENNVSTEIADNKIEKQPVSSNDLAETNSPEEKKPDPKQSTSYYSSTNDDMDVSAMDKKDVSEIADVKKSDKDNKEQINQPSTLTPSVADVKTSESNHEKDQPAAEEANTDLTVSSDARVENNIEQFLGPIPNVITPNGDGRNDVFIIEGKDLAILKVTIMDRAGKVIHSWDNLHGFWDGSLSNGEAAQEGTYFYNIFARTNSGIPLPKNGTILLKTK